METTLIKTALDLVEAKTKLNMNYFGEKFPSATSHNYQYKIVENEDWTEGFWTGILWMMFEYSGDQSFKHTANQNVLSFKERMIQNIVLDHHDLGFLYSLSCVAAYKLDNNPEAFHQGLKAADKLMMRWHDNPGFIQAWGTMDNENEHRFIIDSLLNLPLLYWASDVTHDEKYKKTAERHADICLEYLIRSDGSSYHTYFVDPKTNQPSHGLTRQGYSDDSSWARGQAWAIYGIALNYRINPSQERLDLFKKVTDYFIRRLPEDHVSYWDLIFTDGSTHVRDSGASAIAVCGILEMLPYLSDEAYKEDLKDSADLIVESLIKKYANKDLEEGAPLLNEGVYSWHEDNGVNEGNTWGDYFYVEALMRYNNPDWKPYW